MDNAESLLELLHEVKDPLTLWAFLSVVAVVALNAFLRSNRFHELWSSTLGSLLSADQVFRLARYFLAGVFILLVLIVIVATTAPLILQKLHTDSKKHEATTLSSEESAETRKMFEEALRIFQEEKDYEKARRELRSVERHVTTPDSRDVVEGLVTASFYGQRRHRDGLSHICKLYKTWPRESIRYRFDIHAHIRAIALSEGVDVAEEVAVEFATRCKRRDFSPVWAGIPLAKMEFLKAGMTVFEEGYSLSARDTAYLEDIVEHYPIDAFLDHAYYFMHEFDEVVGTDSILAETAAVAAIQQAKRKDPGHLATIGKTGDATYPRRIALMKRYVNDFPDSDRHDAMRNDLISSLFRSGFLAEGLKTAFEDGRSVDRHLFDIVEGFGASVERFGLEETLRVSKEFDFDAILLAHAHDPDAEMNPEPDSGEHEDERWPRVAMYHGEIMNDFFEDIWEFLRSSELRAVLNSFESSGLMQTMAPKIDALWKRYFDENGFRHLVDGDIGGALDEYNDQRATLFEFGLEVPELLVARIDDLEGIVAAERQGDPEMRLAAAILLRDIGAKSVALERFESIADSSQNATVVQKALYLAGASLRRTKRYGEARSMFERLWRRFPDGYLADDALAELGWYYLVVERDRDTAHEIFNRVVSQYPNANAADNALNWLGWSYLENESYVDALASYVKLVSSYGGSRLGERARATVDILQKVVGTGRTEVELVGISTRRNYVSDVDAEDSPLRFGDEIMEIDGYTVVGEDSLVSALGSVAGDFADVRIKRGSKQEVMKFRIPVKVVEVYDSYWSVKWSL